jgi:hypothetical protein
MHLELERFLKLLVFVMQIQISIRPVHGTTMEQIFKHSTSISIATAPSPAVSCVSLEKKKVQSFGHCLCLHN